VALLVLDLVERQHHRIHSAWFATIASM
jgi:hypothetical protein